jgi:DNA-binding ferritin-like protein
METTGYKLKRKEDPVDKQTAACVNELMNAAVSFHQMHLKVTGVGSYAAHKALNELYDALPGHADDLAEGYQGAAEKILQYENSSPIILNSIEESLSYIRNMYGMITTLQAVMPYSEIVNELDTAKSTLNSIKYKLLFLK